MRHLKVFFGLPFVYLFFLSTGSQLTSCKKNTTTTVHDTTVQIVRDTSVVVDSIYDLTDGLVAYYNFNGGSLQDSSGFNNNISFNNATQTNDRFGNANNAYSFDGSSSYMQIPNSPTLNPDNITILAIVKVNGFYSGSCHENQIIGKCYSDNVDGFYDLRFTDTSTDCSTAPNTNNEAFYGAFGDNLVDGDAALAGGAAVLIQTGQWYNLVYTYDGINAKMFINGVLINSRPKAVTFTPNTYDIYIGKDANTSFPYYFNGVIDEIRIYNRALGPGAIKQLNNLKS